MELVVVKVLIALVLAAFTYWVAKWPLKERADRGFWDKAGYLSRGIFLGLALVHLLPEAQSHYVVGHGSAAGVGWVYRVVALTFLCLWVLEYGVAKVLAQRWSGPKWLAYWLSTLLAVHALLAGFALGSAEAFQGLLAIAVAILAHKGAEAFALGVQLAGGGLSTRHFLTIVATFSLMTPLGILGGLALGWQMAGESKHALEAIIDALSAGTFVYLATEPLFESDRSEKLDLFNKTLYFGGGLGLMVLINW